MLVSCKLKWVAKLGGKEGGIVILRLLSLGRHSYHCYRSYLSHQSRGIQSSSALSAWHTYHIWLSWKKTSGTKQKRASMCIIMFSMVGCVVKLVTAPHRELPEKPECITAPLGLSSIKKTHKLTTNTTWSSEAQNTTLCVVKEKGGLDITSLLPLLEWSWIRRPRAQRKKFAF